MENPYLEYYSQQAGSGISGYAGSRYHVGNGFFGKILKHLKPALRYIGKQGWEAIKSMSSDVMSGDSFGEAGKKTILKTAENVLADAADKFSEFRKKKQTGGGRKRKRSTKKVYKRRKKIKKAKKTSKKPAKKVYKKKTKKPKRSKKTKKKIKGFF